MPQSRARCNRDFGHKKTKKERFVPFRTCSTPKGVSSFLKRTARCVFCRNYVSDENTSTNANLGQTIKWGSPMSSEKIQNLQDTFLNSVRKSKTPLTVFLINGVKLQGVITWFDNFCVLLRRDGNSQLVYKHAISTVMPSTPVQLFEPEVEQSAASE